MTRSFYNAALKRPLSLCQLSAYACTTSGAIFFSLSTAVAQVQSGTVAASDAAVTQAVASNLPLFQVGVREQVTHTDNSRFATPGQERSDTVLELAPFISIRSDSKRLQARGTLEFAGMEYLRNTQRDRFLPLGSLQAQVEAVENFFFFDAGLSAVESQIDPFGVRTDNGRGPNTQTVMQYRLSPYIQGRPRAGFTYLLRSDNTLTATRRASDGEAQQTTVPTTSGDGYYGRQLIQLEQQPQQWGTRLSFERVDSKSREGLRTTFTNEVSRAALLLAATSQVTLGVRFGQEQNNYALVQEQSSTIRGAELTWRPSERTTLNGVWEKRFFGNGWDARFSHRMPFLAFNFTAQRDVQSFQQLLFSLPAAGNVTSLLDGILTTRFPDPAQRAALVEDLIRSGRLPANLADASNVFAQGINRVTAATGSVALLGRRHSLAFTGERRSVEDLSDLGLAPRPIVAVATTNYQQTSAGLAYALRVSALNTLALGLQWSNTKAIGSSVGNKSEQESARLQWSRRISNSTEGVAGMRITRFTPQGNPSTVERATFLGLTHRF